MLSLHAADYEYNILTDSSNNSSADSARAQKFNVIASAEETDSDTSIERSARPEERGKDAPEP